MKKVFVNEEYQQGYWYSLKEPIGEKFADSFQPDLTPQEMLELGIFGGAYFKTIPSEFPNEWFNGVRLSNNRKSDKNLNYFKVNASQSLEIWQKNGWIYFEDPLGWFLWYCRYYCGRRIPEEDLRQINRWKNMNRHVTQLKNNCIQGDITCRPRQRQALLHWAYDSQIM